MISKLLKNANWGNNDQKNEVQWTRKTDFENKHYKVIKQIHNSYECLNRVWGIHQMKLQSKYKFHFYKRFKLNNFLPLIWRFSWLKAYRTMVHRHKTADNPIHSKNWPMLNEDPECVSSLLIVKEKYHQR